MQDILRESIVGQAINALSKGRYLPYPEDRPDFVLPHHFLLQAEKKLYAFPNFSSASMLPGGDNDSYPLLSMGATSRVTLADSLVEAETEKSFQPSKQSGGEAVHDPYLVKWYGENDSANPQNWSNARKCLLIVNMQLLTFTAYIGASLFSTCVPGVMKEFHVSQTKALLGMSMYVLAYGMGPMVFSPLSEIPSLGRLNVYMVTFFIFLLFQIPAVLSTNIDTLIFERFVAGFFCSPAMSTGGGTLGDTFRPMTMPYVMALWGASTLAAPVFGPVAGGFAAQEKSWRWPLYILLFLTVFTFIVLALLFPETSHATILRRRAQRLRKLTGNKKLRSQGEIDQAGMSRSAIMKQSLSRPFVLLKEPIVFVINLYIALVYSIFYLWFEAFPIVFTDIYGFSLGESALPFLGFVAMLVPSLICYFSYQRYVVIPKIKREGMPVPEAGLRVALVGACIIPVALFIFGWTARKDYHWMGAVIGSSLYLPGLYLILQEAFCFLAFSYGPTAASVLAGNALLRATSAAVFPLFGHALFTNLGIGPGCTMLAVLSIAMIGPLYLICRYGAKLRSMSKYAMG